MELQDGCTKSEARQIEKEFKLLDVKISKLDEINGNLVKKLDTVCSNRNGTPPTEKKEKGNICKMAQALEILSERIDRLIDRTSVTIDCLEI